MASNRRVIVGMSGGVDSSVTAYLLKESGYDVEGLSFILYEARLKGTFTGCCSIEAINDAQRTAESIGVRHSRIDLREEFMEKVIEPFIEAYSKGLTPNPCILCNRYIKFPYLFKIASERDARFIATGHYARVEDNGLPVLKKGIDIKKDQSYVLYILKRDELRRLILPLGYKKKDEVRSLALSLRLPAAKRPESQEICFIEDRNYFRLLNNVLPPTEGPIIDVKTGNVLGKHQGIHLFTIGQRKRLGISTGKPLYVVRIDPAEMAVYVGPKEMALQREFEVKEINWFLKEKILMGKGPASGREFRATVKIRSMMKDAPALITLINEDSVRVSFDEPQWAPAPGQSAVFYDKDIVVGGGIIR